MMFKILAAPENIDEMILAEFDQNHDLNPVRQTYQALLSEANQAGSFQNMALALEKTGDYFIESANGVLSAVRMYQFAITCLTQAPGQKTLTNLMKNAYRAEEEFYSKTVSIPADIFRAGQLPSGLAHSTAAFDIRLVFKAGTALLLQDQLEQAQDFFEKALTLHRLGLKRKTLDRADVGEKPPCRNRNLIKTQGQKAAALQQAMQTMDGRAHPRCWAPFILIGALDCDWQIGPMHDTCAEKSS